MKNNLKLVLLLAALWLPACSGGDDTDVTRTVSATLDPAVELNTLIGQAIEIDEISSPGDANLASESASPSGDPADGSAHAQLPPSSRTFIDWSDLDPQSHRLMDDVGRDVSSFPGKDECVGSSKVLSKMDLTYVASANNAEHAYFAVQRSNNNGDAGYYWLFTQKKPHLTPGAAPCKNSEDRLTYDVTGPNGGKGDVLLVGQFNPSSGPLLRVFKAKTNRAGVPAGDAIDYLDATLWVEDNSIVTAAVNTTPTDPGTFGATGVGAMVGNNVDTNIFAESAVPMDVFTGGSPCGAVFYGSVISRPSGSGGTSPDLKDLAGPALFNFGTLEAKAVLQPTCGLAARYSVNEVLNFDGTPLAAANYTCNWQFSDGTTSSTCSGMKNVSSAGPVEGTVTVDLAAGAACSDTVDTAPVSVYPTLTAKASATAACDLTFSYSGTVSGGSPEAATSWAFSGDSTPSTSSNLSGTVSVGSGSSAHTATLTVTDMIPAVDSAGNPVSCSASDATTVTPYAGLNTSLSRSAVSDACVDDAVTYTAVATGGTGAYTYDWTIDACDGQPTCTIDPADSTYCDSTSIQVRVGDNSGICTPAVSETETYEKKTTVTATDN